MDLAEVSLDELIVFIIAYMEEYGMLDDVLQKYDDKE